MAQTAQKIRVVVRVSLPLKPPTEGCFFVSVGSSRRGSPGTLMALLNSDDDFLPFEDSDGLTKLLSRRHLQWVHTEPGIDQEVLFPPACGTLREELVQLRLKDGTEARGFLVMEIPDEKSRASDFMNSSFDYFTLSTAHGLLFVNKHCVLEMVVFETSPLPGIEEDPRKAA